MGEPVSTTEEMVREVASAMFHPTKGVPVELLRDSGLHRDMMVQSYALLSPEIKNLTGWKMLSEYDHLQHGNPPLDVMKKGQRETTLWLERLSEANLSECQAILMYNGEHTAPPAKDYRLFLLRDGQILYYAGGIYSHSVRPEFLCGSALEVLAALDKKYPNHRFLAGEQPFLVMVRAFSTVLRRAIASREQKLADQKKIQAAIDQLVSKVTFK